MATKLSDIDTTVPADVSAANQLASRQREFKSQVVDLLGVSFTDTGALKTGALTNASQIGTGVVGSAQLSDNSVGSAQIQAQAVGPSKLSDQSVLTAKIADNAVTAAKLGPGAVTEAKLGAGAVGTTNLKNNAVTNDKILDGTISSAKINTVDGSKITAGTLTADRLKYDASYTGSDIRIPVVGSNASETIFAKVAGVLSATLNGPSEELTFAFGSSLTDSSSVGVVTQTATAGLVQGVATHRLLNNRVRGDSVVSLAGGNLVLINAGVYLVIYMAQGYSCGYHKAALTDASDTTVSLGCVAYAPPGQQTLSIGVDLLSSDVANVNVKLKTWCSRTHATNGQGVVIGGSSSTDYFSQILVIAVS